MNVSTVRKTDDEPVDIGVARERRAAVAEKLSGFLASTYTLYMKTLNYHWNVTGKEFSSLHGLFEAQYEDLHKAGDGIAERIRALGHFAPGTFQQFIELSAVEEDQSLPKNSNEMITNLLQDNEACSKHARDVLEAADEADDEVTVDMMVARMSTHDEAAWMLRATLQ